MPEEKKKPQALYPTDRMREMVAAIRAEKGLTSDAAVYFQAVGDMYHKLFPTYAVKRGAAGDMDPTEIARHKVAVADATAKEKGRVAIEEKKKICTVSLKGTVEGSEEEGYTCVFSTYNFNEPDEQRVPLEMVSHEFAKHQNVTPKTKSV